MREDDHKNDQGKKEDNRESNGDAIEILLHQASAGVGVIQAAGDGIRNTSALTRMKHDESNQANAGTDKQDKEDDNQRRQFELFLIQMLSLQSNPQAQHYIRSVALHKRNAY